MKKSKIKSRLAILFMVILIPCLLHAGPGFGDDVNDDVPVDGGLSVLLAAGVGYGIKRAKKRSR